MTPNQTDELLHSWEVILETLENNLKNANKQVQTVNIRETRKKLAIRY